MPIMTHRTVEHTYSSGDQSVLKVQTIEFDTIIDDERAAILITSDGGESVMIHSRDQLKRLISNLQAVADNEAAALDDKWEREQ